MIGLIGIKEGMSRVFTEDGNSVPVTVVKIDSNVVTQIKKIDSEGYSSVQISTGTKKEKHLTKNQHCLCLQPLLLNLVPLKKKE